MQLLVTEKPSVASAICNALGTSDGTKHDGYIEGKDIIATWCKGHLVEMAEVWLLGSRQSREACILQAFRHRKHH